MMGLLWPMWNARRKMAFFSSENTTYFLGYCLDCSIMKNIFRNLIYVFLKVCFEIQQLKVLNNILESSFQNLSTVLCKKDILGI